MRDQHRTKKQLIAELAELRGRLAEVENFGAPVSLGEHGGGEDEWRYRKIFDECPISLWELDCGELLEFFNTLQKQKVVNIRKYFETNPGIISRCLSMIKVTDVNKASMDLYKVACKQKLLCTLDRILPPVARNEFRELLLSVANGEKTFEDETPGENFAHEAKHFIRKFSWISNNPREFPRAVVSLIDVTNLKVIERKLAQFKTVADKGTFGSAIATLGGNLLYTNESFAEMHGYKTEDLIARKLLDFFSEEEAERVKRMIESAKAKKRSPAKEVWHRKCDGSFFPTLMNITFIKDERGTPSFLSISAIDISQRKQVEEALRESEKNFRALAENANDCIMIHGAEETVLFANKEASKLTGYKIPDLLNKRIKDIVPPEIYKKISQRFTRRLKGVYAPARYEASILTKDKKRVPVESTATRTFWRGQPAVLVILRDITDRKRVETELRMLSAKLLSVQEDEKKRIAREMHDGFGQTLTAIKFAVENALQSTGRKNPNPSAALLNGIIPMIKEATEGLRKVTRDLRPTILDNEGITATIEWFCEEFGKIYPMIRIRRLLNLNENAVPPSLKVTIFRILQEAFNNVAKHSQAGSIMLSLKGNRDGVELVVKDNGRGFDLDEVSSKDFSQRGFGLISMSERTSLSGGSFSISTAKAAGTVVRAQWTSKKGNTLV